MIVSDTPAGYQVLCICGGHGFPRGTATAARITMVGRALQQSGIDFRVLHCGPSPTSMNVERSGVHEGIPFQYTTTTRRPKTRLLRQFVYLWAVLEMTFRFIRLFPERRRTAIYLYLMQGPVVLHVGILCRVFGFSLVQELCEWWPGDPRCSPFDHWLHKKAMFRSATGVLAISRVIEERVRERGAALGLDLHIYRLPALVDAGRFMTAPTPVANAPAIPEFLYCGTWKKDVFFLMRVLRLLRDRGYQCRLCLVLGIAEDVIPALLQYANEQGLSADDLTLVGSLDHEALARAYKNATALLMPLWADDRSITRLPNKMGEYLASGRAVVTSGVGDLTDLLIDGVSAFIARPGDERLFADKMAAVLEDPCRAEQVGAEGQKVCLARLDFRQHATALSGFFTDCIKHHNARMTRDLLDNRSAMFIRNLFCRTMGMGIILSGLVRRARTNALQSGVVTSIYFHSPNQKLFTQCVRWLRTNGYTFITTQQLIDIVHGRLTAPRGAVWLSFDDGCRELLTSVLPVVYLEKVPIALFIPAGIVEGNGLFPWRCNTFNDNSDASANETLRHSVTVLELQEIARHPEVTIGSHTMSHTITPQLSEEALRSELKESKSKLESWSGTQVTSFAYPVGKYDGKEARILRECGYELAATTEATFLTHAAKAFEIPRFHVGDNIPFAEAACNMVGVWYPVVGPLYKFLRRCGAFAARFRRASPRLQLREPQ